ncbi:MAG: hypothetical protein AAF297_11710, partial [Planctomycetota bacterium]
MIDCPERVADDLDAVLCREDGVFNGSGWAARLARKIDGRDKQGRRNLSVIFEEEKLTGGRVDLDVPAASDVA